MALQDLWDPCSFEICYTRGPPPGEPPSVFGSSIPAEWEGICCHICEVRGHEEVPRAAAPKEFPKLIYSLLTMFFDNVLNY